MPFRLAKGTNRNTKEPTLLDARDWLFPSSCDCIGDVRTYYVCFSGAGVEPSARAKPRLVPPLLLNPTSDVALICRFLMGASRCNEPTSVKDWHPFAKGHKVHRSREVWQGARCSSFVKCNKREDDEATRRQSCKKFSGPNNKARSRVTYLQLEHRPALQKCDLFQPLPVLNLGSLESHAASEHASARSIRTIDTRVQRWIYTRVASYYVLTFWSNAAPVKPANRHAGQ